MPDSGPLALEAQLRDERGKVLAFASAGVRSAETARVVVLAEPEYRPAAKPGKFEIEASGIAKAGLEVEVIDRFGRIVCRRAAHISLSSPTKRRFEFDLAPLKPLCVYHEIVANLRAPDQRLVAQASADVFLLPSRSPYADRFMPGVHGAPERRALHLQAFLSNTRRVGLMLHSHGRSDRMLYSSGGIKSAHVELKRKKRYAAKGEKPRLDRDSNIMYPPLVPTRERIAEHKKQWVAEAKREFASGVWDVAIDDERSLTGDFDFHPQTLTAFRAWLKTQYPSVQELNRSWGSTFADFGEVQPIPRKKLAADARSLAPWLDHRVFMGEVIAEYYMKMPVEWAGEVSPKLRVGEAGVYLPNGVGRPNPVDWSRYASLYRFTRRYDYHEGALAEYFRAFAPGVSTCPWLGYGMNSITPRNRIAPWRALFNGGRACYYYSMTDICSTYSVLTADNRPHQPYVVLAREELPDLTGGIDQLIIASKFTDDRIAILYSFPSILVDTAAMARYSRMILKELGFQYNLVTAARIASDRLQHEGYRLLVVPESQCLTDKQVAGIRRFAQTGGTVLCLGRSGPRDEHGAPHPAGSLLDPVLGVNTGGAKPLPQEEETPVRWGDRKLSLKPVYTGALAGKAKVLAHATIEGRAEPVLTVNSVGKGKVFWLNSCLHLHRPAYKQTKGAHGWPATELHRSRWAVFNLVVSEAGIRPRSLMLRGGKPFVDRRGESWYYLSPSGRSLFIGRYIMSDVKDPITIQFVRAAHVYDLRKREYLGITDVVEDTLVSGRVKVYALLDYKVTGLAAALNTKACKPGDILTLSAGVKTDGKPADLHALRLQVADAIGEDLPAHRTVVLAPGGKAEVELPMALNQPLGEHTVTVTDVCSGAQASVTFTVARH